MTNPTEDRKTLEAILYSLVKMRDLEFGDMSAYQCGLWSRSNLEAMIEDVEDAISSLNKVAAAS
jgi:hypothetical protein